MATKTIKELQFSGLSGDVYVFTTPYAICSTDASIAEKVASVTPESNFSLETGSRVTVKFTVTNTASNPTLNVNSTGAKAIYYGDSAIPSGNLTAGTYEFVYSGAQWDIVGGIGTNTGASTNTDTKVTQTVTTSNALYPLLLAPSGQTATTTTTSYFDSGVTLNPSTNTIATNISGTATKAIQDGDGNVITSTYATKIMKGYIKPDSAGAITASDTINSAIGKLEKSLDGVETLLASI